MNLPERIVAVHRSLQDAGIAHAFGGALALAWCTQRARGTIDIDVNVFAAPEQVQPVLDALPAGVRWTGADVEVVRRDGQVRLWWDATPVDLFFSTTPFHDHVLDRVRNEPFLGTELPFLSCVDLAVFKAFFDRTRDWADLEEMAAAGCLDAQGAVGVLVTYLGPRDHRIERLRQLDH